MTLLPRHTRFVVLIATLKILKAPGFTTFPDHSKTGLITNQRFLIKEWPSNGRIHPKLHAERKKSAEEQAQKLREQAERLRSEVSKFEKSKEDIARSEKEFQQKVLKEKSDLRLRYSAEVPILKGNGSTVMERVDFPPRFSGGKSIILAIQSPLPLGIVLGESEEIPGTICVDEVAEESNGEASGVRVGDLLRACTACQMTMETPTWQLMAGGIGRPKTNRFMFSVDGRPFEEVMDAVGSNRMDPEGRPAWLVLERPG